MNKIPPTPWFICTLFAVSFPLLGAAQELYQQRFNEQDIELLEGAMLGGDGSGVSGKAEDRAYTAAASSGVRATAVFPTQAVGERGEVEELTVTAWYKPTDQIPDGATLFSALGTVLIWDAGKRQWVWRVEAAKSDGSDSPYWFYLSDPPMGEWSKAGEWTFIALVWNRNERLARFYQGDPSSAPALGREMLRGEEVQPLDVTYRERHTIGNDRFKPDRAFVGEIDNVRFYEKALDDAQLSAIYSADLANESPALP